MAEVPQDVQQVQLVVVEQTLEPRREARIVRRHRLERREPDRADFLPEAGDQAAIEQCGLVAVEVEEPLSPREGAEHRLHDIGVEALPCAERVGPTALPPGVVATDHEDVGMVFERSRRGSLLGVAGIVEAEQQVVDTVGKVGLDVATQVLARVLDRAHCMDHRAPLRRHASGPAKAHV